MHDQQELSADLAADVAAWEHALTPAARRAAEAAQLFEQRSPPLIDAERLAATMGVALWYGPMAFAAPWLFWAAAWRAMLGACATDVERPGTGVSRLLRDGP